MNKHADIAAEEGTHPTRTSELLREFARSLTSDRVTLAEIIASLGDRDLGVLIAIFALPNILPSAVRFSSPSAWTTSFCPAFSRAGRWGRIG